MGDLGWERWEWVGLLSAPIRAIGNLFCWTYAGIPSKKQPLGGSLEVRPNWKKGGETEEVLENSQANLKSKF